MALPLAAIAAVASTAYSAIQRGRVQSNAASASTALSNVSRSALAGVGGAIVGGSAGAFVASQVARVGQGNVIPGIPTPQQFQRGLQQTGLDRYITGTIGGAPRRRYRRMNVCNVKALRRAGRRVEGFVKLAKSLVAMPGARARFPIKKRGKKRC